MTRTDADTDTGRDGDTNTDTETKTGETATRGLLRNALSFLRRVLTDIVVVGFWVGFLTLVFLSTGWPRWLYYALLLGGVVCYTQLTPTFPSPSTDSS